MQKVSRLALLNIARPRSVLEMLVREDAALDFDDVFHELLDILSHTTLSTLTF